MTIRQKTALTLAITLLALVVVLYSVLSFTVRDGFSAVERQEAGRNLDRVREAFQADIDSLCAKVFDWAAWDSSYEFMVDRNGEYIAENLLGSAFTPNGLNLILYFDTSGRLFHGMAWDLAADREVPLPEALIAAQFPPGGTILAAAAAGGSAGLLLPDKAPPLLYCAKPILRSDETGPTRGTIVFAGFLDQARIERLRTVTRLGIDFFRERDPEAGAVARREGVRLLDSPAGSALVTVDDATLLGYVRPAGRESDNSLVAEVRLPRDVNLQARRTLKYLLLALLTVGVVFMAVVVVLMEYLVVGPVTKLSGAVVRITETFDFSRPLRPEGNDEISRLGRAINSLLAAVEQMMHLVRQNEPPGGGAPRPDDRKGGR